MMMMMSYSLIVVAVLSCCCWASPSDDFYYHYVRPEPVLPPSPSGTSGKLHGPEHDYTDYSRHYTRSDQSGRNSAAQPPPSGPYFAHELKSYYHNNNYNNYNQLPPLNMIHHNKEHKAINNNNYSPWNSIHDTIANEYSPPSYPPPPVDFYSLRPGQRPFPPAQMEGADLYYNHPHQGPQQQQQRPLRKPISKKPIKKKQKKRPPANHQTASQTAVSGGNAIQPQQQHPAQDKVADIVGAQSIASAYPNGVMGTLSLMAGLVWYLVNKSATPVVKMRQDSSSGRTAVATTFGDDEDHHHHQQLLTEVNRITTGGMKVDDLATRQLMDYWMSSLKENDCQLRAVCELVSESPIAIKNFIQSIQDAAASIQQEDEQQDNNPASTLSSSKAALLLRAVSNGERGVDCSAFYPSNCGLPFRLEPRDRRRRRRRR